jgi:hypothetical protein
MTMPEAAWQELKRQLLQREQAAPSRPPGDMDEQRWKLAEDRGAKGGVGA